MSEVSNPQCALWRKFYEEANEVSFYRLGDFAMLIEHSPLVQVLTPVDWVLDVIYRFVT